MHKKCYRTHMVEEQEASRTKRAHLCDDFSSLLSSTAVPE